MKLKDTRGSKPKEQECLKHKSDKTITCPFCTGFVGFNQSKEQYDNLSVSLDVEKLLPIMRMGLTHSDSCEFWISANDEGQEYCDCGVKALAIRKAQAIQSNLKDILIIKVQPQT